MVREAQVATEEDVDAKAPAEVLVDGEAPVEEGPQSASQWYVIHTYSGYENKVKTNLEHRIATMDMKDKIFQVVIPVEDEVEVKDGQRRTVQRKVFPGYVLVQMLMGDDSWYVVRNTPGVTGFVGSGNQPIPLPDHEVKAILKQMKAEAPRLKIAFLKGQSVRIIDGPFAEFIGVVDDINHERGKVRVLVSFFGRETPVELDFLQVEKL
jgi:transcription termination/antitermination protein NusG